MENDFDDYNNEIGNLMEDHDLGYEEAEEVHELMDTEGLDEEEAIEIKGLTGGKKGGGISWIAVIFIIILIAVAYNHFTSKKIEEDYGYKVETSGITDKPDCSSLEPQNPYGYDSGHSAGFEWGAEGKDCGGNSDSFIEGCQEYQNQEDSYQYCLSRNK
jgi:hypothetical protein